MMNRLLISVLLVVISTPCLAAPSKPKRISGHILDLGEVHSIYMVGGMATLIILPTSVTGIRIGNPDAIQYFRPDKPENEVTLVLKDASAKPTNLILESGRRRFVFDLIPSSQIHQDIVDVVGAFGAASLESSNMELIESSETRARTK